MLNPFLTIIVMCFPFISFAQDIIIDQDGEEIEGRVIEITLDEVRYRSSSHPDGPMISLPLTDLLLVKFSNGKRHVFKAQGPRFKLGQDYGGGIIFYIDQTGEHGLIAAKQDYSEMIKWGKSQKRVGANSYSDGSKNTEIIVDNIGSYCAAATCQNLSEGGYNDWYLPSIEELYRLYHGRDFISGWFRPGKNDYCSSTEHTNRNDCLGIHFGRGGKQFYYNKREPYHVRAIRKF